MSSNTAYAPVHNPDSPHLHQDPSFADSYRNLHGDSQSALARSQSHEMTSQKEYHSLRKAYPASSKRDKKFWIAVGIAAAVLAAIGIGVGVGVSQSNNDSDSGDALGSGEDDSSDGSSSASPSATPLPSSGADNSLVTLENGDTFTYHNPFGGHWVATPYDNSARAQDDVPPLNEEWDFETMRIDGVNVGGWLVTEPFISPALFEPYLSGPDIVYDEYDLSIHLGDQLAETLTEHYDTFITEHDFAQMVSVGLNWIRFPVPWWMIETVEGEPHLEGAQFSYFVRGLNWARKYGIRVKLDLHAVPGSQNGWNHSGRSMGSALGFLGGNMGVVNAERTLNYLKTLIQFVSQPQYAPVVPLTGILNEPRQNVIGDLPMRAFYYQAYNTIRDITGIGRGNGPLIVLADGFGATWEGFMSGADRLGLDHHFYQAFDEGGNDTPLSGQITRSCNGNAGLLRQSLNNFGVSVVGEWSIAMNDCGQFVTAVNDGTRYQGNFSGSTNSALGSCDPFNDWWTWDEDRKAGFRDLYMAGADAAHNTFFWTWTCGNSTWTNRASNPMWNFKLGIEQGFIPSNVREAHGACDRLADQYSFSHNPSAEVPRTMEASQVGRASDAHPTSTAADYVNWPPSGVNSISPGAGATFEDLPRYTPTGTPITLTDAPTPTVTGESLPEPSGGWASDIAGSGWANPSAAADWYVPVSGCEYLGPYDGFNASVPAACGATPAARKRSPDPLPEPTPEPQAHLLYKRRNNVKI